MNYLFFLAEVKKLLPEGMTLSIAAPASFWYLKAFPIDKIARIVDYIVYMTYDLHGKPRHTQMKDALHANKYRTMGLWKCFCFTWMPGRKLFEISYQLDGD